MVFGGVGVGDNSDSNLIGFQQKQVWKWIGQAVSQDQPYAIPTLLDVTKDNLDDLTVIKTWFLRNNI